MMYKLDGKNTVKCNSEEWIKWMKSSDRTVALEKVTDDVEVSTVFLGIDHSTFENKLELFETMIFGGDHHGDYWRYETWEEAKEGHEKIVKALKEEK